MRTRPGLAAIAPALLALLLVVLATRKTDAASPLLKPSNADTAFRQVPLLSPSGGTDYVTGVGHITWPTFLDSTLVKAIGGTDSILIASTRTQGVRIGLNGSVTYTFPPNTYANRVGAIVTADDWTDPAESTLPMLIASFTFEDGRTWGTGTLYDVSLGLGYPFLLYYRVRDWSDQVVPGSPGFVTKPLNPAVFQLCAQASNGGVGNVYSDLQTFFIPDTLHNTTLHTVTFASHTTAFDSTHITSAHGIVTGLAVWPSFSIVDRQGDPVPLLSQADAAWRDSSYGGFYKSGRLYGTRRTIRNSGCNLTCYTMAHQYLGMSVSPNQLNRFLQLNGGYSPEIFATLSAVADTTLQYAVDTHAVPHPVGDTIFVLSPSRAKAIAQAVVRSLSAGVWTAGVVRVIEPSIGIAAGAKIATFGLINPVTASKTFSNGKWVLEPLRSELLGSASAESTLIDSMPVFLHVKNKSHFVLATGWRPAFVGADTARGTYTINDPGYSMSRLIEGRYRNQFSDPRACKRLATNEYPLIARRGAASVSSDGSGRLVLAAYGGSHVSLMDPLGHVVQYDDDLGRYIGNIPGVVALRQETVDDEDDSTQVSDPVDLLEFPAPEAGDYDLTLWAERQGEVSVYAAALDDTSAVEGNIDGLSVDTGTKVIYRLTYTGGSAPTATLTRLLVVGVPLVQDAVGTFALRAGPNPSHGVVQFSWLGGHGDALTWEVFDVRGRRIRSGTEQAIGVVGSPLRWDGLDSHGMPVAPGVYLVRARRGDAEARARIVLLR